MRFRPLLLLALGASSACASTQNGAATSSAEPAETESTASAEESASRPTLPDFRLRTIDGEKFALSNHVGKDVIIISFWATWCMPCLAELPHLSSLYEMEKDEGLMVVAVSMDEPNTQAEVAPTAQRLGLEMPVVIDDEQRAVRLYNKARSAPMTILIDRNGRIVMAKSSFTPGDEVELEKKVKALLADG